MATAKNDAPATETPKELILPDPPLPADLLSPDAREPLLKLLRMLTLRHDEVGQELVLNHLLRNLLHHNLFGHAEKVLANCVLHQPYRSTNQAARFHYYVGLVRAMQLDYDEAASCFAQALRKTPERALGFRIAITKLALVAQLLIGEIPPRSEFLQSNMKEELAPYLQLTSCVRFGNLARFQSITNQYQKKFEHDRTYSLILRVRQNVIKTGLRRLCHAYTRIALSDVSMKLALDNPEDAEYIVAKAIRDGVIDASIDHEKGHVVSSETVDAYATAEPIHALQKRVQYCNQTHNDARRGMRYGPPKNDADEEERRRAEEEEREIEQAIEDGEFPEEEDDLM